MQFSISPSHVTCSLRLVAAPRPPPTLPSFGCCDAHPVDKECAAAAAATPPPPSLPPISSRSSPPLHVRYGTQPWMQHMGGTSTCSGARNPKPQTPNPKPHIVTLISCVLRFTTTEGRGVSSGGRVFLHPWCLSPSNPPPPSSSAAAPQPQASASPSQPPPLLFLPLQSFHDGYTPKLRFTNHELQFTNRKLQTSNLKHLRDALAATNP